MFPQKLFIGLVVLMFYTGCGVDEQKPKSEDDTINSGSIIVSVDETLRPLMESEFNVFSYQHSKANLQVSFKPEREVLMDFTNDSARAIVFTRELNAEEMEYFRARQYVPRSMPFAKDAIALIGGKNCKLDSIKMEAFVAILKGNETLGMNIIFDNAGSSTFRWIKDSLLKKENPSKNCFALKNSREVIKYVEEHDNAIGVIGNNIVSNLNDSAVRSTLKTIKRISVAAFNSEDYALPYQSEIETGRYPLTRMVYCIQRDGRLGLGTGVQRFLYDETGQLIVLKSGVMPFKQPERSVHFNEQ